ncbi:MAG: VOC family protein, partial [Dongiaceae bacterium]
MIGRLNHVAIAVPDLAAASALYRDTLGAKVSAPMPQPAHGVVYYRDLARAGGTYFTGNGSVKGDGRTLSGVIFAEGVLVVDASRLSGAVTFVSAGGRIEFKGDDSSLTP